MIQNQISVELKGQISSKHIQLYVLRQNANYNTSKWSFDGRKHSQPYTKLFLFGDTNTYRQPHFRYEWDIVPYDSLNGDQLNMHKVSIYDQNMYTFNMSSYSGWSFEIDDAKKDQDSQKSKLEITKPIDSTTKVADIDMRFPIKWKKQLTTKHSQQRPQINPFTTDNVRVSGLPPIGNMNMGLSDTDSTVVSQQFNNAYGINMDPLQDIPNYLPTLNRLNNPNQYICASAANINNSGFVANTSYISAAQNPNTDDVTIKVKDFIQQMIETLSHPMNGNKYKSIIDKYNCNKDKKYSFVMMKPEDVNKRNYNCYDENDEYIEAIPNSTSNDSVFHTNVFIVEDIKDLFIDDKNDTFPVIIRTYREKEVIKFGFSERRSTQEIFSYPSKIWITKYTKIKDIIDKCNNNELYKVKSFWLNGNKLSMEHNVIIYDEIKKNNGEIITTNKILLALCDIKQNDINSVNTNGFFTFSNES